MEFIQNTTNGSQLDALNDTATKDAKSVIAAVAYVTDCRTLIDKCWKHQKPLTLFARYDYSGPVSHEVLEWFLSKSKESSHYEMRLIGDIFHPKVIWWQDVGVYIGSANLSKSAWGGNVEAGVFLSEEDLDNNEMRDDLEEFFETVSRLSCALNKDIADQMVAAATGSAAAAQTKAQSEFEKIRLVPRQHSLISITRQPARVKYKAAFLEEWAETLKYLRELGQLVNLPENRPPWLPPNVSGGVLADQFLHAFYYNKVRDGHNYPYRALFEANKANRDNAVKEALAWWRTLPAAPSNEDVTIKHWAPEVRGLLSQQRLANMTEHDFENLCLRVHAVRDHAIRVSSTTLGLRQGMQHMVRDDRIKAFAKWLYAQKSPDGSSPCELLEFVLRGGPMNEIPNRIFAACFDESKKIAHMGVSTIGEMVGWAMPDDFPPRNGRTSKALTALGYRVKIHSE